MLTNEQERKAVLYTVNYLIDGVKELEDGLYNTTLDKDSPIYKASLKRLYEMKMDLEEFEKLNEELN